VEEIMLVLPIQQLRPIMPAQNKILLLRFALTRFLFFFAAVSQVFAVLFPFLRRYAIVGVFQVFC
jgi:hypothetical protein